VRVGGVAKGRREPMKRLFDNLFIDLCAATLMVGMAATGYILRFPLPPGSNKSLSLWGLTRHQWGDVHFWISLALLGIILLHVVLHRQWLVITMRRKLTAAKAAPGFTLFCGLTTLLVIGAAMTLFAWATHQSVESITATRKGVCPPPTEKRAEDGLPPGYATDRGKRPVTFWKDVYPILEQSCLSCHGPKKQHGDFRVDRREDFFGKGSRTPLVVPGNSGESPLVALVSGLRKDIPRADVHQLPSTQVAILRGWIDAGAPWPEPPAQE
jgi:hypothetical protein